MVITKIISNNAVVSLDELGNELVIMGSGVGFKKKVNDTVDSKSIEKTYKISSQHATQFERLVMNMPYEHVGIADEIIKYAQTTIGKELNENIYITLTDHVSFAIERKKLGIEFDNALLWEIKQFYNEEYKVGLKALDIIEDKLGIRLSDDEAGFIALHVVNAQANMNMTDTIKSPKVIDDILNIVKDYFGIEFDKQSISYERFVTHLKFFIQRVVKQNFESGEDEKFYRDFLDSHKESADCARKIAKYVNDNLKYEVTDEELMYIAMHIERVVKRDKAQ